MITLLSCGSFIHVGEGDTHTMQHTFYFLSLVYLSFFFILPELQVDIEEEVKKYKNYADRMRPLVTNAIAYLHECLQGTKKVLVEGANAAMLDIDFGKCLTTSI